MLDYIHEHAPKVRPTQIVNTETCAEIWKTHISSGLTHVSQNFDGVLMRTRVCKMGHKLVSYEIFRVLTLQLTKAKVLKSIFTKLIQPGRHTNKLTTADGEFLATRDSFLVRFWRVEKLTNTVVVVTVEEHMM